MTSRTTATEAPARTARRSAEEVAGWRVNRPSRGWPRLHLEEIWIYRELVLLLAMRDFKLRYKQTFFGAAWAVMQPLAGVAVFSIVFGRFADLPSDGLPYPVFVYAGLVAWTYFATSIDAAARTLVESSALVTKVFFPRLLAPAAAVLPGLIDLLISLGLVAVFMASFGLAPTAALLSLPIWIVMLVVLSMGVGFWLSALNVQYRDVRHALGFVVQVWLFASPVVYPSSLADGIWRYVLALNPATGLIDGFRWSLLGEPTPRPEHLLSLAVGLALFVGGAVYFRAVERHFADVI